MSPLLCQGAERLEVEDAEHESPNVSLEQIQQDIDKSMEVMDKQQDGYISEQQAKFDEQEQQQQQQQQAAAQ